MPVGPDFISLQVRDLDTAAAFFEQGLGLLRAPASPPSARSLRLSRSRSPSVSGCPTLILTPANPVSGSRSGSRSWTPRRCMTSSPHTGSRS
jgi:hypothetical protein